MKTEHLKTAAYIGAWFGYLAPLAALAQPVITTQPTNHFANTASSFNFYVGASGTPPLSYQWLFNGAPIAGASRYYLTVLTPRPTQWGYYSVIVTNASGSLTSQLAELKIFTAARHSLSGIQAQPDGSMKLSFAGETTAALGPYYDLYPLEGSSNLLDWAPLAMLQRSNTALDTLQFADTNAGQFTQRFYRTPTNQLATPDPSPTGPYPVGTFSMLMIDPSRTNAAGYGTNYQFMTTFWYPTASQAGVLPAVYVEPQIALAGYYDLRPWAGNFGPQVAAFYSHSWSNAPLATNLSPHPVVLYDPGWWSHRRENTDKAEDLASWGYVVVALDTSDTGFSVFPDGRIVTMAVSYTNEALSDELRVLDMQFVLDQLAVLNANDPRLRAQLDLDRIGAYGASEGGAIVAELCRRDARCKAAAGYEQSSALTTFIPQPAAVPYLSFRSGYGPDPDAYWNYLLGRCDDRLELFNQQVTNAYWVKLISTFHAYAGDDALVYDPASLAAGWGTPMSGQLLPGPRVSQLLRAYLLSFFNKFLKDQDDHLLDGPSPAYPEVMQFLSTATASGPPKYPRASLVEGSDGNFYGTTAYGGAGGGGVVFRVTTNGQLTTLVSFTGANGSHPMAALLQGSDGNFYGTTAYGGSNGNHGTVFQMTPVGVLTTLVSFNGTNGSHPYAGLVQGSDGNFYGTTSVGGANNLGTVFRMTPAGVLTILFSFNNTNGSAPFGALVQGTNGDFYGTTSVGGTNGMGTVFQMTPAGVLTRLVSFTSWEFPSATLVQATNGLLYGTTEWGGNTSLNGGIGFGTVFEMTSAGLAATRLTFNGPNGTCCVSGLVQGTDGNFYGTTAGGGLGSGPMGAGGTVFRMTPAGTLTTLVSFNGANGNSPQVPLIQGSDGNFYGTTTYGGPGGCGTVFQVTTNGVLTTLAAFGNQ